MKKKTIYLGEADMAAIAAIKERYGLSTDSDAIRLALRILDQSTLEINLDVALPKQ